MWKLNDDLFTSTKLCDANATGNVSMSSSVCMYQKNTLELAFFSVSLLFFMIVPFLSFSEYFGVQFCCYLQLLCGFNIPTSDFTQSPLSKNLGAYNKE